MAPLTNLRHETFVRAYVRRQMEVLRTAKGRQRIGERESFLYASYQEAYPHVRTMGSLYAGSSRLFKKPYIQERIREVTKRMLTRMDITEENILSQYGEAYDMAKSQGKTADMVSATTAQAKLVGLLRDRIEAGAPGDFDKLENVSDVLAAVEREAGPDAALMLAKVLGLNTEPEPPVEETAPEPDAAELEKLDPPTGAVN